MIERIMVPTDGSPEGDRAIPIAETIAKANGAEVLLSQIVKYPAFTDDLESMAPEFYEELIALADQSARANVTRLSARLETSGVKTRTQVVRGNPALNLLDLETSEHPDLVVMSSHGRTGVARFALGSIADRMVREGSTPVLIVRRPAPPSNLENALLMLDGSAEAEAALPMVDAIAGHPIKRLKLFRAVADPDDRADAWIYLESIKGLLSGTGMQISTLVDLGDPTILIDRLSHEVDLIILSTHGRGGFDRVRHGSVTERIVREATKPVLLVRIGMPIAKSVEPGIAA